MYKYFEQLNIGDKFSFIIFEDGKMVIGNFEKSGKTIADNEKTGQITGFNSDNLVAVYL